LVLERIAAQCMGSGVLLVKHRTENGYESENGFRNKDSILIWVSTYGIIHMAVEQDRDLLHLITPYPMQHTVSRAQRGKAMLTVLTQNKNHSLHKFSGGDYIYQCADLTPVRVADNDTRRKFNSFS